MKKYIELATAEKAFREAFKNPSDTGNAQAFINILRHDVPAADVRPVVRGEWRKISNRENDNDYECTACLGIILDVPEDDEHPLISFCPNCGAEMRKEAKDD